MALTDLDFTAGIDFTALNPATGGDHVTLIELATPRGDTGAEGKGIVLWTKDTALGVPNVPNAVLTTKWQRYLWFRRPHATDTDKQPKVYGWNDDAASDATLLKWQLVAVPSSEFEAQVNAALAAAQVATATANTALATANTANATATTALANANDAVATAGAVADDATNALAAATDAQAQALASNNIANDALNVANGANTTATSALSTATLNRKYKYALIVEQKALGVNAGDAVAGANIRQLNIIKHNDGAIIVSNIAGVVTIAQGTFRVRAYATGYNVAGHVLFLIKNSDNSVMLNGSACRMEGTGLNLRSELQGIIETSENTAIRLDHHFSGNQSIGLGRATGLGPVAGNEIYAILEIERLDN